MSAAPGIIIEPSHHVGLGHPFRPPNRIGVVLHRTEAPFDETRQGFVRGPKCARFLIGKTPGNAVQMANTSRVAGHAKGANEFFIGIEFESRKARPGYEHRTDPLVNAEKLTPYQLDIGRFVIGWICRTNGIPLRGPPSRQEMVQVQGRYRGLMNHADLVGFFVTTHGNRLLMVD
jgi:hypothetical protein